MPKNQNKSLFEGDQAEDIAGGHIIRVAFESGVDNEFDYLVPDKLWPVEIGKRVEAPFGKNNKIQKGFCVNLMIAPSHITSLPVTVKAEDSLPRVKFSGVYTNKRIKASNPTIPVVATNFTVLRLINR